MEVKDIIKKRREELGLTYEQLGDMVGVGKSTVRKWEIGMIENMKRSNIAALAKALDISPMLLMGLEVEENKQVKDYELSKDKLSLIKKYDELNDIGKKEAVKRVEELTYIDRYKEKDYLQPIAAHNDNLTEEEKINMDRKIEEALKKMK